jgi:hypothetical protein
MLPSLPSLYCLCPHLPRCTAAALTSLAVLPLPSPPSLYCLCAHLPGCTASALTSLAVLPLPSLPLLYCLCPHSPCCTASAATSLDVLPLPPPPLMYCLCPHLPCCTASALTPLAVLPLPSPAVLYCLCPQPFVVLPLLWLQAVHSVVPASCGHTWCRVSSHPGHIPQRGLHAGKPRSPMPVLTHGSSSSLNGDQKSDVSCACVHWQPSTR